MLVSQAGSSMERERERKKKRKKPWVGRRGSDKGAREWKEREGGKKREAKSQ